MKHSSIYKKMMFAMRYVFIIALFSFVLTELALRALNHYEGEPTRGLITEAQRIGITSQRLNSKRAIKLPENTDSDALFIGDSMTFGYYLNKNQAFPDLFGGLTKTTAINLGVPNTWPPQYNRMLEVGIRYEPEVVFYGLFANDFMYDEPVEIRDLQKDFAPLVMPQDHSLYFKHWSYKQAIRAWLKRWTDYLVILQLLKLRTQPFYVAKQFRSREKGNDYAFVSKEYWEPMLSWKNKLVQDGTALTIEAVKKAQAFSKSQNIRFVVTLIPSKEMVYGPYSHLKDKIYDPAFDETYDHAAEGLRKYGIEVIDLREPLRAAAQRGEKLYFSIDGHLNEKGHLYVALQLQKFIQNE